MRPGEVDEEGIGPLNGRMVELDWSGADEERVRNAYRKHVEAVDAEVGPADGRALGA